MTWWVVARLACLLVLVGWTVVAAVGGTVEVTAWMWLGVATGFWMGAEPPPPRAPLELPRRRPGGGQ